MSYCCAVCGIVEWQEQPLSLQLDHINGIHSDCRRENLRWLCPNCHTQTSTWGAKQRSRRCLDCGKRITKRSDRCLLCANARKNNPVKIQWPMLNELCAILAIKPYAVVAANLGVSDSAIRKWLKKNGIDPKSLGHRAKTRIADRVCDIPGCRWNTHRVCDSYCRECRELLKAKEKACERK